MQIEGLDRFLKQLQVSQLRGEVLDQTNPDRALNFIGELLTHPEKILIQEWLEIDKIAGRNIELGVEYVSGVTISAVTRYGFSYLPEINNRAIHFFDKFLDKVRPDYPKLTGSAAVALLRNGSLKVIEFGLGSDTSGFKIPRMDSIPANWFLTVLSGKKTKLIAQLLNVMKLPLSKQIVFLSHYSPEKKIDRPDR